MNDTNETRLQELQTRVQRLHGVLAEQTQQQRRKRRLYLIAGSAVFLLSFFFLASLTADAAKLDAEAVLQIARQRLEGELPERREEIRAYLEGEAPNIIATCLETLLGVVPELRTMVVRNTQEKLKLVNAEFESQFLERWQTELEETREDLEIAFQGSSDVEKVEKLVAEITDDFRKTVEATFDALYPDYTAEMNRVKSYLVDLQHKSASELTEKERLHKEIIETLLRLALRSQHK